MPTTALDIGCRYCHAPPHQPCHNQLTNNPHKYAHPCRVKDAETIIPLPTTVEEELF